MAPRSDRHGPDKDAPAWFAPKKVGYGAGLPIAWQGWALLAFYVVGVTALAPLAERSPLAYFSVFATLTVIFLLVARKTTPGGWRWRSGREGED